MLREGPDRLGAPDLALEQRQLDDVEVLVEVGDLVEVLGLDLAPRLAQAARRHARRLQQQLRKEGRKEGVDASPGNNTAAVNSNRG